MSIHRSIQAVLTFAAILSSLWMGRVFSQAAEPKIDTKSIALIQIATEIPAGSVTGEAPTPIPANTVTRKIFTDTNGNRITRSIAGAGSGKLVYSNDLGRVVFGPGGIVATERIADDIGTIALPSESPDPINPNPPPPVCSIDRYVIRVNGDRSFTGKGAGDYTVTTALHDVCPGAKPDVIPGTRAETTIRVGPGLDVENASDIIEITVTVPPGIDIGNLHYISVQFSRDQCGVVMGAPARIGFSDDRFDFPGTPCTATLGGFPVAPHASFGVDIYVRKLDCPGAHLTYRNTNHSGQFFTPGINQWTANRIQLVNADCLLTGYEFAYRGNGVIQTGLRLGLLDTDPLSGLLISDSRTNWFSSALDEVQVGRHMLPEPVQLKSDSLFVGYRTTSTTAGPLVTCQQASLGQSNENMFVYNNTIDAWETVDAVPDCFDAIDFTLFCAGEPIQGACCDMVFTDENGESTCREVASMNCSNAALWERGGVCESICEGGDNLGMPCTRHVDCPGGTCPGPFVRSCGLASCCKPDGTCQDLTANECLALSPTPPDFPAIYQAGEYCGVDDQFCLRPDCVGDIGSCTIEQGICVGGSSDGVPCDPQATCPEPSCCPDGGICQDSPGCDDATCCSIVCDVFNQPFCCEVHWDAQCAETARQVCSAQQANNECYAPGELSEARELNFSTTDVVNLFNASEQLDDPGFCCHSEAPGAQGVGTVWYKFIAPPLPVPTFNNPNPDSSILVTVEATIPFPVTPDTLVQLFRPANPDLGICSNGTACSVAKQNCSDTSYCQPDFQSACQSLEVMACSDEHQICFRNLVPNGLYYLLLAAKAEDNRGGYTIKIAPNCPLPEAPPPGDCDADGTPDVCDIAPFGNIPDCDSNGIPDHCDPDCNEDDIPDTCQMPPFVETGDCDADGIFDECELFDSIEMATFRPLEFDSTSLFQSHRVAIDGLWALVGTPIRSPEGFATMYRLNGNQWMEDSILHPAPDVSTFNFGHAVEIRGRLAAIGTSGSPGSVFIFRFSNGVWIESSVLEALEVPATRGFGQALALEDGIVVVGAPLDDTVGEDEGAVYVFRFVGEEWLQEAKFTPMASEFPARFGSDVAVYGNAIVVAAPGARLAYIYHYVDGTWDQFQVLSKPQPSLTSSFAEAVDINDGRVITTQFSSSNGLGFCPGIAHIFQFDGLFYQLEKELGVPAASGCGSNSVSLIGDTTTMGDTRSLSE